MSDQLNKQQNQGTQQDDWKKNNPNQQGGQQGGQSGQQSGESGQQKTPQSDRDQFNKDQQKKQA